MGEQGSNLRLRFWSSVKIRAIADAAAEPGGAPHPVLMFSPGYTTIPPDYTFLAEDLASRGYVVVGVTPTYSARAVVFSDGRIVKPLPETTYPPRTKQGRNQQMTIWAAGPRVRHQAIGKAQRRSRRSILWTAGFGSTRQLRTFFWWSNGNRERSNRHPLQSRR